jgi:hypothetical protein
MNETWDIADEDISIVVASHKVKVAVEQARAVLDESRVFAAVGRMEDFADQVAAASCEIEDQLMAAGVVPREAKKFEHPAAPIAVAMAS